MSAYIVSLAGITAAEKSYNGEQRRSEVNIINQIECQCYAPGASNRRSDAALDRVLTPFIRNSEEPELEAESATSKSSLRVALGRARIGRDGSRSSQPSELHKRST